MSFSNLAGTGLATKVPVKPPISRRELDVRESDGVRVQLLWEPGTDCLLVAVTDQRGTGFKYREVVVLRGDAHDAFYHPFAYLP